jgi:hypothetical protein
LSIFDAVILAKLLRLVCDTAAVRARGHGLRREAERHAAFVRAMVLKSSRLARAGESAVAVRMRICQTVSGVLVGVSIRPTVSGKCFSPVGQVKLPEESKTAHVTFMPIVHEVNHAAFDSRQPEI